MHISLQEEFKGVAAQTGSHQISSQHQSGAPRPHETEKA